MLILLFSLQAWTALANPPPVLSVQPRHVHLALGHQQGSLILTWSTLNRTEESVAVVVVGGEERRFDGSSSLFVDGGARKTSQWIHSVLVVNLPGNTTLTYWVGSSLGWSDLKILRTPPSGHHWDPTIVMFGDMGNDNAVSLPWIQRETEEGQ